MKYQLVLQMPASSIDDYDSVLKFEQAIIEGIGDLGTVDGHDAGSGEMNIFVLTQQPKSAFARIKSLGGASRLMSKLKAAAYREIGADEFTIIYPPGLSHFHVA